MMNEDLCKNTASVKPEPCDIVFPSIKKEIKEEFAMMNEDLCINKAPVKPEPCCIVFPSIKEEIKEEFAWQYGPPEESVCSCTGAALVPVKTEMGSMVVKEIITTEGNLECWQSREADSVFLWLWKKHRPSRNGVLLLGLCDSGKTVLLARLLHDKFVATYTSVKENCGEATWNNRMVKLVDIPGHERLRGKYFDQYKNIAKAVIFAVDSVNIQKEIRDVAEFLYTILSDSAIYSARPSVLILCNKQDETMAKGSGVVKNLLEKEMNLVRVTKSSQLESTDDTTSSNVFLGKTGKDFEFAHLQPLKVEFAESYCRKSSNEDEADIGSVEKWLVQVV